MEAQIKKTIIICITIISLSCLFFISKTIKVFYNKPVAMEECWNDGKLNSQNLYCKGFDAGYNWQRTQVLMDCEFADN
jgi:hypothetical protein